MSEKITFQLDKLTLILIKATIFLLPLFFLPWTSEYFEFNKQFLLWLLMLLAALLWFGKIALEKRARIKINPLNLPVLIFLALAAAAAVFSLDGFSSWFGYFGRFSDAWLGLLSLVIFYFLIINTEVAATAEKIIGLLKLLLYSSAIVATASLAARFGWLAWASGDQTGIFSSAWFNPAGGSPLNLGIFLAIMSMIPASFLFTPAPNWARGFSHGLKKSDRIFFSACLIIFLLVLSLVNFPLSWWLLLLGAGLMIFFRCLAQEFNFKKILNYYLLIPAALMLAAVLMLALPNINLAKVVLGRNLPKEARLGYNQSWIITKETLKKNPALGSGPGTFAQDFSLYRPAELNSSAFWQVRFSKSSSHFLEILATAGLLAFLSYFLIICLAIYLNIVLIRKYLTGPPGAAEDYNLIASLLTVFILILCSQVFFSTNTVLNFIFWFGLALIIAFWQRHNQALFKEKTIGLNKSVLLQRLSLLAWLVLTVSWIVLVIFAVKFLAADVIAARPSDREAGLAAAIKLNPYRYNYRISLAKFYLNQARAEALKPIGQIDNAKIQAAVNQAIETARQALVLAPNSVLPNETLGMIYRDVRPLTLGSEAWAVKYFSAALELEPTNPVLATELAKAYVNNNDLANAEKYFNRALELKSDYYEAKFSLAKAYLQGQQDSQALILLNELAREVQTADVYYELGRYYYNHGEINKAIDRFKLVLSLSPQQVNSLYSLAIAYEAKDDAREALKYYKQVLELNPGNKEVEKKIKELSK